MMEGIWHHFRISLRLYFRNRMAVLYGYLFPSSVLLAFWVLYRYERVPLVRHMGELLTVTILGGACFGLATTLVGERERGVWRRLRLSPVPPGGLVASTVAARYVLLLTAGLLQLGLAMALGMPWPDRPIELLVAFTVASFAFLGLGLVIAMLADNVPAAQALGQCIFLPMLIIGGITVPLTSLPNWALSVSAYFPGRYAVEAIQSAVSGPGLGSVGFSVCALVLIGTAACIAGAGLFRWDVKQRFAASRGKGWIGIGLSAWVVVGLLAHAQGLVVPAELAGQPQVAGAQTRAVTAPERESNVNAHQGELSPSQEPPPPGPRAPLQPPASTRAAWEAVTLEQIMKNISFDRLPSDSGVVTPVAARDQEPDTDLYIDLDVMMEGLQTWGPGGAEDLVDRVRNLLFVPAVADVLQLSIEPYVPLLVFDILEREVERDVLLKALFWIASHPDEGSDAAVGELRPLGIPNGAIDITEARGRVGVYAVKLVGRITGARPPRETDR